MTLGTTVDNVLQRARRDAHLGLTGPVYTLAAALNDTETIIQLNEDPMHMAHGSMLAVDAELMHVMEVVMGSHSLTVRRGMFGSTAAAHADDSIVEVDPRFPKAAALDWAEQEIRSWRNQLFRIVTLDLPVSQSERTYDLTGVDPLGVVFLLDVRQQPLFSSIDELWGVSWAGDAWPRVEARLMRDMPTVDFPSGYALQLTHFPRTTTSLRVAYASDFDFAPFDLTTDLVADVGLDASWLDIVEQGVRWRALQSNLMSRTDWRAAGMSRDAEEVTLFDIVRSVDMARSLRDRRLADEALTLRSHYPYASR